MHYDRRKPRRRFKASLIKLLLNGRKGVSATLLANGKSTTNYKLLTSDRMTYVLRLADAAVLAKEQYVMRLVEYLAPTPHCLYAGESCMVTPFIPGKTLGESPEATYEAASGAPSAS